MNNDPTYEVRRCGRHGNSWTGRLGSSRDRLGSLSSHSPGRERDGEPTITFYQEALIRNALQDAGVEFTKGDVPGVKLRRPGPQGGLRP